MSMTSYSVDIAMSTVTVADLTQSGFALCAFKAVQSANRAALPVVWFATQNFLPNNQLSWTGRYQAYLSATETIPNGVITWSNSIDINLGQIANADKNGDLTVTNQGMPGAISINNQSSQQWTAGIAQSVGGKPSPIVALPLYGNFLEVMAPVEKILLMFMTGNTNVGTIIRSGRSPGVLVNFTDATSRIVEFDINNGWSWGGAAWGTAVSAEADLTSILLMPGPLAKGQQD